jgi:hypothetical protein
VINFVAIDFETAGHGAAGGRAEFDLVVLGVDILDIRASQELIPTTSGVQE